MIGALLFALGLAARPPVPLGERAAPRHERVVVLGIDGMDPELLAEAIARFPERMRNFARLVEENGLHSLGTSIPPQSPVAWSNFITGRDPGGHGIFDFLHRDPVTRGVIGSTTKDVAGKHLPLWGDWQFPLGGSSDSNRSGRSFWRILREHGVPADIWRMPANFPVDPAKGVSFPGMMTPTLDSAYGTYVLYTTDPPVDTERFGGKFVPVREYDGAISSRLEGPANPFKEDGERASVPISIWIDRASAAAAIEIDGGPAIVADVGEWTDFVPVAFELVPMGGVLPGGKMTGMVRFFLRSVGPEFEMYMSPVNFDPLAPATPISAPEDAGAELAEGIGRYYTQGMAEQVNALKDDALDDEEFIDHAGLVYDERVRMMEYALERYLASDDGGFFFFYYSTVDMCCHMLWHHSDADHPFHSAEFARHSTERWTEREGSRWSDVVLDLYLKMDPVLGSLRESLSRVDPNATVIVMSDHGFAPWHRKFSLNAWLLQEGYLVLTPEGEAKLAAEGSVRVFDPTAVDWSRTRAYGMGFNGLYLNLRGREGVDAHGRLVGPPGIVEPGPSAAALVAELKAKLEAVVDPRTGRKVVLVADITREVYAQGERLAEAPEIQVGYDAGYGNSDGASTGEIVRELLVDNDGGTFNGNHLMASQVVPGILLSNRPILPGEHALEDLTVEILRRYSIEPDESMHGSRVLGSSQN